LNADWTNRILSAILFLIYGVILDFSSAQYSKVLELVLSSGRDALPLEPTELVRDWQENVRDMQKLANSKKK
jgi:hypothetical protein